MSLAPSKSPPSAEPSFDLRYSIHDFQADSRPDSRFFFRRIEEAMLEEGTLVGGRTLDVACGLGQLAMRVQERGGEGWGIDSSQEMLGLSRWVYPASGIALVRSVAESLPFRDSSFDRIICQGSLDHFVDPQSFMRDAARLLRPDGRVVIALANYESLSCRLGRFGRRWLSLLRRPRPPHRLYWETPEDHFHKGDAAFVHALGGDALQLERWYGISLLWLLPGWGTALARLPERAGDALLAGVDRTARRSPGLADMIISIWRAHGSGSPEGQAMTGSHNDG